MDEIVTINERRDGCRTDRARATSGFVRGSGVLRSTLAPLLYVGILLSASAHSEADHAGAPEVVEAVNEVATADMETTDAEPPHDAVSPVVLDLQDAEQMALEQNPSLFAAAARVEQARARTRQARALYFPRLDAEYAATRTHLPANLIQPSKDQALTGPVASAVSGGVSQLVFNPQFSGGLPGIAFSSVAGLYSGLQARSSIDEEVESYRASLTASYIIFDGFSRHFTNAMARFGRHESEEARREAARLILGAVAQSFYGVQLARENVAIAEADEAFNQRLLEEARARRERGTGSKSDVLNFEVALRAAQSARINASGEVRLARVALAALMGLPEAQLGEEIVVAPLPAESLEEFEERDVDYLIERGLSQRPDVQQSQFQVARIRAQLGQRKSVYYPQLSAFASQDAETTDNSRFEGDDFGSTVGINISYNLFAGGRNRADVAEARSLLEEAEYLLADTRLEASRDIRQSAIELQTAREALVLQRTTADLVDENRDLVEKEYRAGQGSLVRLNQAQRDLIEAQARLALARVTLFSARHALETATGETISRLEVYNAGRTVVPE